MKTVVVGAYEAKTKLSSLLDRVARGGQVVITKHDKPVARLVPAVPIARVSVAEALDGLAEVRSRSRPGPESLKDLIVAGRRV